ncbi:MAG: DUF2092 domain-containing protein [Pseudomonadales bacterium]
MKIRYPLRWGLLCMLLAGCGPGAESSAQMDAEPQQAAGLEQTDGAVEAQSTSAAGEIEENAVTLLKQMTSKVASLPQFALTMETGFDVLQPSGQKVEFGSRRTAAILRPDRARLTFEARSGLAGELVFDGTNINAYDREQNVYASVAQPGDIDAAIDLVTGELGISVPASDFFAADPSIALAAGVTEARDLGPSTIDGQPGHHIALRKPGVDYQIWINEATSLPVRVVITYHEEPGQPQFWAQFLQWETAPTGSDAAFEFSPPEGSERIRFGLFDASAEASEEAL